MIQIHLEPKTVIHAAKASNRWRLDLYENISQKLQNKLPSLSVLQHKQHILFIKTLLLWVPWWWSRGWCRRWRRWRRGRRARRPRSGSPRSPWRLLISAGLWFPSLADCCVHAVLRRTEVKESFLNFSMVRQKWAESSKSVISIAIWNIYRRRSTTSLLFLINY